MWSSFYLAIERWVELEIDKDRKVAGSWNGSWLKLPEVYQMIKQACVPRCCLQKTDSNHVVRFITLSNSTNRKLEKKNKSVPWSILAFRTLHEKCNSQQETWNQSQVLHRNYPSGYSLRTSERWHQGTNPWYKSTARTALNSCSWEYLKFNLLCVKSRTSNNCAIRDQPMCFPQFWILNVAKKE